MLAVSPDRPHPRGVVAMYGNAARRRLRLPRPDDNHKEMPMKRSYVAVAAVLIGGGVAIAASSVGGAQQPAFRTLSFTEKNHQEYETKYNEKKFSPDDTFVFTAQLLSNNQPVGRSQGACTATAGNASECRGTLFLKDGKLFILGGTTFNSKTTLGIVGGTGPYIGSRGTLTTTKRKSGDLLEVKLLP
jgi:hypothetical protein